MVKDKQQTPSRDDHSTCARPDNGAAVVVMVVALPRIQSEVRRNIRGGRHISSREDRVAALIQYLPQIRHIMCAKRIRKARRRVQRMIFHLSINQRGRCRRMVARSITDIVVFRSCGRTSDESFTSRDEGARITR